MSKLFLAVLLSIFSQSMLMGQHSGVDARWIRENVVDNPVNAYWLTNNLKEDAPRLFLDDQREQKIKHSIQQDSIAKQYFKLLAKHAEAIYMRPLLEREQTGRRLLGVSREAVRRIGTLALVYRISGNDRYLTRLENEMNAVCEFSDWNPSHFLDVAEMAYAVALGLDWCGEWFSKPTIKKANTALTEKALKVSLTEENYNWWINAHHNWNQVCHGGLSAAAIVVADEYPDLAARILSRAVDKLPLAMAGYSPDGAYPEGPSYWGYGTSYNVLAISMYRSALGTDFNLPESPGFMESANYRLLTEAPSGWSFNYSDAGLKGIDLGTWGLLSWFAKETGNSMYLDREEFLDLAKKAIQNNANLSRLAPTTLVWMAQFEKKKEGTPPVYWKGEGENPIAIFRAEPNEKSGFYLGVKGGSASVNHGNMDVGSFIFEAGGVRWSIDPGSQGYNELEQIIGSELWDSSQDGERWTLLTKNNHNHSTLTVNKALHRVEGYAPIETFAVDEPPQSVTLDLQEIFHGQLKDAKRTFVKQDASTLRIIDEVVPFRNTEEVIWRMMTQADVQTTETGAVLMQDGKELKLEILKPSNLAVSVVAMDPPPLEYDKRIEGLKRIEIRIPGYRLQEDKNFALVVKLQLQDIE
ncbi:MAG: heparinase II/III domain-containing protein [Bacteroidota bacterium]